MATFRIKASNINKSLPVVKKTVFLSGQCNVCRQTSKAKVEFTANELEVAAYDQTFDCARRVPCKGKVNISGVITMPKG